MAERKIILILCHTLNNDKKRDYHVYGNWCARLAKNILKYTNAYNCEVWYAVRNLDEKIAYEKDAITYKLFPTKTLHPAVESYYSMSTSPLLFEDLKKENPHNTIIHFQGERGSLLHKVLEDFPKFKITIQYHGYGQPQWLEWVEKLFITPLEKKNFKSVRHFFVHIRPRVDYLKYTLHIPDHKISSYHNVGIDFSLFKPRDKNAVRKKLNLPQNAFIILYVGSLIEAKGVDKIIRAYQLLKKKCPHLFLLFVGANQSDPLYHEAAQIADKIVSIIPNEVMPLYYNAADVYCFYGNTKTIRYAGLGTAPTEALASNLTVISTNLIHLPDKLVDGIGLIPNSFEDFVNKLEVVIQNPQRRFNARDIVAPYTSYEFTTTNLIKIYDTFFSQGK